MSTHRARRRTGRTRSVLLAGWNAYLTATEASVTGRSVTDADWMADFRIALIALA